MYVYVRMYVCMYVRMYVCMYVITVFEIALVRLSETSDYLPGQVNNPSAVIRWTSETLQPSADFPSNAFEVDTNLGHDE